MAVPQDEQADGHEQQVEAEQVHAGAGAFAHALVEDIDADVLAREQGGGGAERDDDRLEVEGGLEPRRRGDAENGQGEDGSRDG